MNINKHKIYINITCGNIVPAFKLLNIISMKPRKNLDLSFTTCLTTVDVQVASCNLFTTMK